MSSNKNFDLTEKNMRLRLQNNSVEASVQIINQASVPQGLSSHLTTSAKLKKADLNYKEKLIELKLKRNKIELKKKV